MLAAALILGAAPAVANAQTPDHSRHSAAEHAKHLAREKAQKKKKAPPAKKDHKGHSSHPAPGGAHAQHATQQHAGHDAHGGMKAFLGPYGMTREGSGTSWVPDTTPHEGIHGQYGEWSTMAHARFNLVYDRQGGPRGGDKTFVNGMVMAMAQRPLGEGTFGLRAMLSPDPFMGKSG